MDYLLSNRYQNCYARPYLVFEQFEQNRILCINETGGKFSMFLFEFGFAKLSKLHSSVSSKTRTRETNPIVQSWLYQVSETSQTYFTPSWICVNSRLSLLLHKYVEDNLHFWLIMFLI